VEGLTSLADGKSRMKDGQKSIYYITGGAESLLRTSPCWRSTRRRILRFSSSMTTSMRSSFRHRQVRRDRSEGGQQDATSEDLKDEAEARQGGSAEAAARQAEGHPRRSREGCARLRALADSPSCIVSDEEEPSLQMQQMLRAMGQKDIPAPKPTLEINPDHEIVKKLLARPTTRSQRMQPGCFWIRRC
jgi:molecular chaperone HtpG